MIRSQVGIYVENSASYETYAIYDDSGQERAEDIF